VPAIPSAVDHVVLRALEKDPTRRWTSAGAFAHALRDWREEVPLRAFAALDSPVQTRPNSPVPTLVVVAIVLSALAALLWAGFRPAPSPDRGADVPFVVEPSAPEITGRLAEDDPPAPIEVSPTREPAAQPTATAAPGQAAPTIAPVEAAAVAVPNLQGLTIAGATSALLPLGMRIAQAQPVYSASVPLNAIAAQDPLPGVALAPGETVRVSLSRGPSPFAGDSQP
jgi:serine/threonine-protein kinase